MYLSVHSTLRDVKKILLDKWSSAFNELKLLISMLGIFLDFCNCVQNQL